MAPEWASARSAPTPAGADLDHHHRLARLGRAAQRDLELRRPPQRLEHQADRRRARVLGVEREPVGGVAGDLVAARDHAAHADARHPCRRPPRRTIPTAPAGRRRRVARSAAPCRSTPTRRPAPSRPCSSGRPSARRTRASSSASLVRAAAPTGPVSGPRPGTTKCRVPCGSASSMPATALAAPSPTQASSGTWSRSADRRHDGGHRGSRLPGACR